MTTKSFDLIIYGASSFVGQILTHYLVEHIGVNKEVRWAIAGRSALKLKQFKESLGAVAAELPVIIADAADGETLAAMCQSTRVVVTTVGPYALYGEPLVKACAENGTDYCDLCGEAYWIKKMIVKYAESAKQSGARLVSCCGFDSIPSDLGVHFLQKKAKQHFGLFFDDITLSVNAMKGGASGGTIASMIEAVKAAISDPALRKEMNNPYILCPENTDLKHSQISIKGPFFDQDIQRWVAPFIMEAINARVVLRSNMLLQLPYGAKFLYREQMVTGTGIKGRLSALGLTLGLGFFAFSVVVSPIRKFMKRFVLPKPGEGPSPAAQLAGHFDVSLLGKSINGEKLQVRVTGDRDPGYGCTAKMLAQAGLSLAFDFTEEEKIGGFWTPATAMGDKLIDRLTKHAGMTFEVE